MTRQIIYTKRFMIITLAPGGVLNKTDKTKPDIKHITDKSPDHIVTPLKLLERLIAESGGKIISPVISIVPIILMPKAITKAHKSAKTVLNAETFVPVAFVKLSSKVTENIWL